MDATAGNGYARPPNAERKQPANEAKLQNESAVIVVSDENDAPEGASSADWRRLYFAELERGKQCKGTMVLGFFMARQPTVGIRSHRKRARACTGGNVTAKVQL